MGSPYLHRLFPPARPLGAQIVAVAALATLSGGGPWALAQSARPSPTPAKLAIAAPVGASVHVDGTYVGTAPLPEPIDVEPGARFVTVTMTGFHAYSTSTHAARGRTTTLSVDLQVTDQRLASWGLIGTGAAGLTAGIVFGALSVIELRTARDIQHRNDTEVLSADDQRAYDAALSTRDDFRVVSGITASVGFAALIVGGALYVLDDPIVPSAPAGRDEKSRDDQGALGQRRVPQVDVSALPLITPRFAGGKVTVRF